MPRSATTPAAVEFFVAGSPVAQGSAKAFVVNGRARITSTATGLTQWRSAMVYAAQQAWGEQPLMTGPVSLFMTFFLPRPKSLPKTREVPHTKAPDLDKLCRAVGDSLAGVIYLDDRQVARINAAKVYAPLNGQPGVEIKAWLTGEPEVGAAGGAG